MSEPAPQSVDTGKSADVWLRDAGIPPAEVCQLWLLDLLDLETLVAANCFGASANRRWQWSDFDVSSQGNLKYRALPSKLTPRLGPGGRIAPSLILQIAKERGNENAVAKFDVGNRGASSQAALAGLYEQLVEWSEKQSWIDQIPALVASHARYCQSQHQEPRPSRTQRKSAFKQLRPVVITAVLIAIGGYALIELVKNQPNSPKADSNGNAESGATTKSNEEGNTDPEKIDDINRKVQTPDEARKATDLDFELSGDQLASVDDPGLAMTKGPGEQLNATKAEILLQAPEELHWRIDLSGDLATERVTTEPSETASEKEPGESKALPTASEQPELDVPNQSKSDASKDWFAELVGQVPKPPELNSPTKGENDVALTQVPPVSCGEKSQFDLVWDSNLIAKAKQPAWRMILRAESALRIKPFGLQVAEDDRVTHWVVSEKNELPVMVIEARSKIAPVPRITVHAWICFSRQTGLVAGDEQAIENFFSQLSRFQLDIGRRLSQIELQYGSSKGAVRTLLRNERSTISKWQKEVDRLLDSKAELTKIALEMLARTELHGELVDLQHAEVGRVISLGDVSDGGK